MITKVAIPIWNGRVSPVMDTACHFLVVEIDKAREVSRNTVDIYQAGPSNHMSFFTNFHIDILICGAISHQLENMLIASGIKINPWFRGDVNEVIAAYFEGILQNNNFIMPGCERRYRRGRGKRRGRRTGFGRGRQFKEE